jgi:putative membrane protein
MASALQPIACIVTFVAFWGFIDNALPAQVLPFLIISPMICLAFAFLFVALIDRQGQEVCGIRSTDLFKGFMQNWVAGLNEPIERYLEQLGEDEDVEVSVLSFVSSKLKASIIVPTVHPGPFKNIGSSLLPSMLKHEFEREYGGDACVPLGLMGHELDLTSQKQNCKVVDSVLYSAKALSLVSGATPFVRVNNEAATANCQIFGKSAFLSFTLAPNTTEDLPQELSKIVREEATKLGYSSSVLVNTHNSIVDGPYTEPPIEVLRDVALEALQQCSRLDASSFAVGSATVYPEKLDLKDGMGEGGITAIVVKVAQQRAAYIVIDSNNMVSGLREKVLQALTDMGFDRSEVFTTDTHAVSAVVLGKRGYHPLGEAIDPALLIDYLKDAASKASENLEECKAGSTSITVPRVRVIGKERLHSLSTLVDLALKRAKQILLPIFGLEGVLLVILLYVL